MKETQHIPAISLLPKDQNIVIPTYGIGTWGVGGFFEREIEIGSKEEDDAIKSIQAALDRGVTHIDTAEMYAQGYSEEIIGKAIKPYDRSKLFITSKAYGHRLGNGELQKACEESLHRLGTDYLDLYLIHHPNDEIPISETAKAFNDLVDRGLVRSVGVSNFSFERLKAAQEKFEHNPLTVNQVHYSLAVREPENGMLEYCQENGIVIVAWKPLERVVSQKVNIVDLVTRRYNITPAQVAISWLTSQDNVAVIAKTASLHHLESNLEALKHPLSKEDVELLRQQYPNWVISSPDYHAR